MSAPLAPAETRADRSLLTRSLAAVFLAGPVVASATILFPHDPAASETGQLAMAAGAFALGLLVVARGARLSAPEIHGVVIGGTVLLTGFIHFSGDATSILPLFYAWLGVFAFYFMRPRAALAHMGVIAVSYAVALALDPDPESPLAHWLVTLATPLLTGGIVASLVAGTRESAARAAERAEALRESEERSRRILETAYDAFVSMDEQGRVTAWNPAAEAAFGWRADEVVGRELATTIIPPAARELHRRGLAAFLETGEGPLLGRPVEVSGLHRDGHEVPVELTIAAVPAGAGWSFHAFLRDVRDRRRAEAERAQLVREQAARAEAEALAERVQRLQALSDAALGQLDLEHLLQDLVEGLKQVVGVDAASILLLDDDREEVVVRASTAPAPADGPVRIPLGAGIGGRVAAERQVVLVHDPQPGTALDPAMRDSRIGSLIGVPLMRRDEVMGVINAGVFRPRRLTDEEISLIQVAADRVALAVDRARLFEREHRIAETLQRSLLPSSLPEGLGMNVAARYRPAAAESEVGGDWYDVLALEGGRLAVALGDVEGKGLRAASAVGQLRSAFRAYALEGHGPAAIAERLNRLMLQDRELVQLATLAVLIADPAAGRVRIANAGHLPPVEIDPDGRPRLIDTPASVPLGVVTSLGVGEGEALLTPGSTLLLYTDGLVERRGESLDEGLAELLLAVEGRDEEPGALCDHTLAALLGDSELADDVAVLALRSVPLRGRVAIEVPAEPSRLATLRGLLARLLREADADEGEVFEVTMAAGEACTNVVEHAYGASADSLRFDAEVEDGEVVVRVGDRGSWRPEEDGDSGRGLDLMRALMHHVDVRTGENGTEVELRRRLRAPVAP